MGQLEQLKRKTRKELIMEFDKEVQEAVQDYDVAMRLSSLGVSLDHVNMYLDAVKKIREIQL